MAAMFALRFCEAAGSGSVSPVCNYIYVFEIFILTCITRVCVFDFSMNKFPDIPGVCGHHTWGDRGSRVEFAL